VTVERGGTRIGLGFHQARTDLIGTEAISDVEMDAFLGLRDDPGFAFVSPLMMVASGQRPLA
jgi:hypothetical protein